MRAATACLASALIVAAPLAHAAEGEARQIGVEEFLALVDGKTVHFSSDGEYYGSEAYHPNRRSVWRDAFRGCEEGVWVEYKTRLCFEYDSISCWKVFETPEGGHYAVSEEGLRVDFDRIEPGAFDCEGIPLG